MALPTPSPYFSRFGQCEFLELDKDELDTTSLQARVVKSPAREKLLSQHRWMAPTSATDIEETTLLQDLGRLAPSLVKEFLPKSHAESTFSFRLINDVGFQGEEDGYIALSYCRKRGMANTSSRIITPVGHLPFGWQKEFEQFPLPTTAALFQAVIREKRAEEGLWFDQVCIEQEEESDKTALIGAVDVIYKNARTVVIVLDDIAVTSDEEQFLRYYVEQYNYTNLPQNQQPNTGLDPPFMQQYDLLKNFLERILCSEWFERAWCAHEMRSGQSHIFLVPCLRHYEDEVQTIIRLTGAFFTHLLALASELVTFVPPSFAKIHSLLDFFQQKDALNNDVLALRRPDTPQSLVSVFKSLSPLISDTFRMKAGGNPRLPEYLRRLDANRDKTCIALNMSGLPLTLAPPSPFSRPNIEDECLRSLLLVGIAAGDPVALCTMGTPLQLHDGSVSWLCRPTSLDVIASKPSPAPFSRHSSQIVQATDGRAEYAQIDLVFLELPHRTKPSPSFPAHVVRARTIVDFCVQYQIPGSGFWGFSRAPHHPRTPALRNIFIQTLACVLKCGLQWLLEVHSSVQENNTTHMDPYTMEMLLNPHLILENFILLPEGQAAMASLVQFLSTLISSGIPWPSGASERTHGPLIIAAPSSSSSAYNFTGAPSYSGKAIIFAPFEHSKTLLIAVPAVVRGAEYAPLARGWILTSMNPYTGGSEPTVSWTLQSKGRVFGDMQFNSGLAICDETDARNHRVYGPSRH
ncbi:O-methyltransferase family 2 [Pyrenophora seminiperda CCB06]|uniref:O-methyltransferase family 2 n=1 Tax=Pyrenophora seminiperda CCB06 TaxID=1302712 RepID=A0A3M7MJE0_9PLEO|nr:O-methyltransferase family 2 [Pyrenophora seminiperda CCB06]